MARKRASISKARSTLYRTGRILGDIQAIAGGPNKAARRVARRAAGKAAGRLLGRLFK